MPVIISRQSADAVHTWLVKSGLSDYVQHVIAGSGYRSWRLRVEGDLLTEALRVVGARSADRAYITETPAGVETARGMGMRIVGYARAQADLTLRLRAGPLAR